jgi:hypothetical protein
MTWQTAASSALYDRSICGRGGRHSQDRHESLGQPTMGYVEARYPSGKDGDPDAVPGIAPEAESDPDALSFTLEVDGERFVVRVAHRPGADYSDTGYTWLSGPNKGYGFSIGGPSNPSLEDHRERIRDFLAGVDPSTGYLKED